MVRCYWLKLALKVGVSYDIFWRLNPRKLKPFIEVYSEKVQEEIRVKDYDAWLQGLYIQKAVASVLNGGKAKYPQKPLGEEELLTPEEVEERKRIRFEAGLKIFNKKFQKQSEPLTNGGESLDEH